MSLREHPEDIWWVAGPLAVLALGLTFIRAILQWRIHRDPWFLVIWVVAVGAGGSILWHLRRSINRHRGA